MVSGPVTEILEGFDRASRDRVGALRKEGHFFWIDVALSETSPDDLSQALGIPEPALRTLLSFGEEVPSSRKFHADGRCVVLSFSCYLESGRLADGGPYRLRPVEVHMLVSGGYLLTLHEEQVSLPELLAPDARRGAASNTSSTRSSTQWSPALSTR